MPRSVACPVTWPWLATGEQAKRPSQRKETVTMVKPGSLPYPSAFHNPNAMPRALTEWDETGHSVRVSNFRRLCK